MQIKIKKASDMKCIELYLLHPFSARKEFKSKPSRYNATQKVLFKMMKSELYFRLSIAVEGISQ